MPYIHAKALSFPEKCKFGLFLYPLNYSPPHLVFYMSHSTPYLTRLPQSGGVVGIWHAHIWWIGAFTELLVFELTILLILGFLLGDWGGWWVIYPSLGEDNQYRHLVIHKLNNLFISTSALHEQHTQNISFIHNNISKHITHPLLQSLLRHFHTFLSHTSLTWPNLLRPWWLLVYHMTTQGFYLCWWDANLDFLPPPIPLLYHLLPGGVVHWHSPRTVSKIGAFEVIYPFKLTLFLVMRWFFFK